jgi:uncharacterized protein (TIGR00106 family)
MVTAEFSVTCSGPDGTSHGDLVRIALEPLIRRGLKHEVEPLGTTMEGSIEHVFEAVQEAHEQLIARGVQRLVTTLRIEDKRDGTSMADKLEGFRSPQVEPHESVGSGSR